MTREELLSILDRLLKHTTDADAKLKRDYGPGATYYLAVVTEGPGKHIKIDKEYLADVRSFIARES